MRFTGNDWAGRLPVFHLGVRGHGTRLFAVPTLNSPIPDGKPFKCFLYWGMHKACLWNSSQKKRLGCSTIRRDGWISFESGRSEEGKLVTQLLPAEKPMKLELNVNCDSGWVAVDVLKPDGSVVPGYEGDASRVEHIDEVRHHVQWKDNGLISPIEGGQCRTTHTLSNSHRSFLFAGRKAMNRKDIELDDSKI